MIKTCLFSLSMLYYISSKYSIHFKMFVIDKAINFASEILKNNFNLQSTNNCNANNKVLFASLNYAHLQQFKMRCQNHEVNSIFRL